MGVFIVYTTFTRYVRAHLPRTYPACKQTFLLRPVRSVERRNMTINSAIAAENIAAMAHMTAGKYPPWHLKIFCIIINGIRRKALRPYTIMPPSFFYTFFTKFPHFSQSIINIFHSRTSKQKRFAFMLT